jgi:hypothetical protein
MSCGSPKLKMALNLDSDLLYCDIDQTKVGRGYKREPREKITCSCFGLWP